MSLALTIALPYFSLPLPCLVEKGDPSKEKEKVKGGPRKRTRSSLFATDGRNRLVIFPFLFLFVFYFLHEIYQQSKKC